MKTARNKQFGERYDALAKTDKSNIHVELLDDYTLIINPKAENPLDKRIYKPSPTFKKFHADPTQVKLVKGPYGSGKSTGCAVDVVINAIKMPACVDGIRHTRCAIVRNTSPELWSTTIKTWQNWFGELGQIKKRQKPICCYDHTFNDKNGTVILEVLFLALDNEKDVDWIEKRAEIYIRIGKAQLMMD